MGMLWLVLVFPSATEFSTRLPDSASIFTADIWAIDKALDEIKNASYLHNAPTSSTLIVSIRWGERDVAPW